MARRRLTTFSKLLITVAIVGAIVLGIRLLLQNTSLGDKVEQITLEQEQEQERKRIEKEKARQAKIIAQEEEERLRREEEERIARNKPAIKVQLSNSLSALPGIYFNKGFEPNEESRFFTEYGFKVQFVDFVSLETSISSWLRNEIDLLILSPDELPGLIEALEEDNPKVIMQTDWSRGDLALLAKKGINSIAELEDKRIVVQRASSAESYLYSLLESNGMSSRDIIFRNASSQEDAVKTFVNNDSEAMIITSVNPEALARKSNANILQSTAQASHAIARTFVAKQAFIDEKKDILNQFYKAWMTAVSELNSQQNARTTAANIYAKNTDFTEREILQSIENIRFATHGDNLNFFGENTGFTGPEAEEIYKELGKVYGKIDLAPKIRPRWKSLVNLDIMSSYQDANSSPAESQKIFSPETERIYSSEPIAIKPLNINFAPGQADLTESAKSFIDVRIGDLLKTYGNSRIRLEGNVSQGNDSASDQALSLARAKSVMEYLIERYNFNPNRFLVKGNGAQNPVPGCETMSSDACKAKNRRIEFHFLAE